LEPGLPKLFSAKGNCLPGNNPDLSF
jgi:hypothetical protein